LILGAQTESMQAIEMRWNLCFCRNFPQTVARMRFNHPKSANIVGKDCGEDPRRSSDGAKSGEYDFAWRYRNTLGSFGLHCASLGLLSGGRCIAVSFG
jgi:hypothetical protein